MRERILVVDDEAEIAELIEVYLRNEDMEAVKCGCAAEALARAREREIDLAILDIMLPDMDGMELCRRLRSQGERCPIIMLTARDTETDKIAGLAMGADDYVTKPFQPLVLTARVKAQLRRYKKYNPPSEQEERPDGLTLDRGRHECRVNGAIVPLTPTEFSLLEILLRQRGRVVSPAELFQEIWQGEVYLRDSNSITVHIRHLREKLENAGCRELIRTVWGVGYKIE